MRKLILLYLLIVPVIFANAQISIKLDQLKSHIGDTVKVCGKVYNIRYLEQVQGQPTYISLGAAYPDDSLTVMILNGVRKQFDILPELLFRDNIVCVFGKVEIYKEKPQIVIRRKEEIEVQ